LSRRVCFRRHLSWLLVTVVEALEQFTHAALGVGNLECLLDPGNRFFGRANLLVQPGYKVQLLRVAESSIIATGLERTKRIEVNPHEQLEPTGDGFGVEVQNTSGLLTVVPRIKQQDGLNTFGDAPFVGLLVAPL
jgi:hypothetical protein